MTNRKRWVAAAAALSLVAACGRTAPPAGEPKAAEAAAPFVPKAIEGAALDRVEKAVEEAKRRGLVPVVVFDLDGTLFDNRPRTLAILREFAASRPGDPESEKVFAIPLSAVQYGVRDTLEAAGIADEAFLRAAQDYWWDRFFTDTWVVLDRPLPGAVEYVRGLHRKGAWIVYVTGRDIPGMFVGTARSLKESGFPIGTYRTMLVMKPDPKAKDTEYKRGVVPEISAMGVVVAEFENEPRNANAFREAFPDAIHILLDTPHSANAPEPHPEVVLVEDFRR